MAGATAAISCNRLSPTFDTSAFSTFEKDIIDEAYALSLDYVSYRLRSKFEQSKLQGLPREFLIPSTPTTMAAKLRGLATQMEAEYPDLFETACTKLVFTPPTAHLTFNSVAKEIFQTGNVNWGRIVALFTFGGVVAHHFVETGHIEMVQLVSDWIPDFIANNLLTWIRENGGWVSFYFFEILY